MYKLLLCWRYLRTRYLAMACIISVMLGVATLIVVNSVMSGFATKLRDRLHGILSDIVIESAGMEGFDDPQGKMAKIRKDPRLKDKIEAMTPTLEVFAILEFDYPNGERFMRPIRLIGVDPKTRGAIGGFNKHLVYQKETPEPSFAVSEKTRERYEAREVLANQIRRHMEPPLNPDEPQPMPPPENIKIPRGAIVGNLIASIRTRKSADDEKDHEDVYLLNVGDPIVMTTVSTAKTPSGAKLGPVRDLFAVVDYFKSEMSEYDSQNVFVELEYLQHLRSMDDRVTSIQIKLKDYGDAREVVDTLRSMFPTGYLRVETWENKQGALLQAINIERGILNVLLFLIIAVAGFGILAIFSMIVAEKTRDIGILKALGASNGGVMKIFLTYGLLLGVVGAGLGTALGITLTINIDNLEKFLSKINGQEVFNRGIYYFDEIPTDIQVWTVILVNLGAVAIAVVFSVLPALRAAMLHPVRALRYE